MDLWTMEPRHLETSAVFAGVPPPPPPPPSKGDVSHLTRAHGRKEPLRLPSHTVVGVHAQTERPASQQMRAESFVGSVTTGPTNLHSVSSFVTVTESSANQPIRPSFHTREPVDWVEGARAAISPPAVSSESFAQPSFQTRPPVDYQSANASGSYACSSEVVSQRQIRAPAASGSARCHGGLQPCLSFVEQLPVAPRFPTFSTFGADEIRDWCARGQSLGAGAAPHGAGTYQRF